MREAIIFGLGMLAGVWLFGSPSNKDQADEVKHLQFQLSIEKLQRWDAERAQTKAEAEAQKQTAEVERLRRQIVRYLDIHGGDVVNPDGADFGAEDRIPPAAVEVPAK